MSTALDIEYPGHYSEGWGSPGKHTVVFDETPPETSCWAAVKRPRFGQNYTIAHARSTDRPSGLCLSCEQDLFGPRENENG